ncbi:aminoacyl-tRNA hydrolase [Armatimonadetes bacterium Uphvl-Ar1]|nr:aminoacyl-tRNA hydrolase [Armatimonadetes bacterium Uphvl-Ar1]
MGFFKKSGPKVYPKKMIVGLGNPGSQYVRTRHNVGFDVIDLLAERHKVKVNVSRKQALIAELELFGVGVALVKPLTFMNLSGRAVKELASGYGIRPEDILVVTDDLDLTTGVVKMKPKGSSGDTTGTSRLLRAWGARSILGSRSGLGRQGRRLTMYWGDLTRTTGHWLTGVLSGRRMGRSGG